MPSREARQRKEAERRSTRIERVRLELDRVNTLKQTEGGMFVMPEDGGSRLWIPTGIKGFVLNMIAGEYTDELSLLEKRQEGGAA
jgi:hypothetical protein